LGVVGSGSGLARSARLDRKFTLVGLDRDGINHNIADYPNRSDRSDRSDRPKSPDHPDRPGSPNKEPLKTQRP
jgi:hypothetical protein